MSFLLCVMQLREGVSADETDRSYGISNKGIRTSFNPNFELLEEAATKLVPFLEEVVFVGGITLGLLITDHAAAPIRATNDVDIIAEIITYMDYIAFSKRLRANGFMEDMGEDGEEPLYLPLAKRET